jgi:hypothetical protein
MSTWDSLDGRKMKNSLDMPKTLLLLITTVLYSHSCLSQKAYIQKGNTQKGYTIKAKIEGLDSATVWLFYAVNGKQVVDSNYISDKDG